ncbi:hypothetical protein [Polaribacter porphyrae]|uniref:Lipoprotein n=1 Tax=Polaribacter porphyrae TaxID=1137780 RepID=A0A2S7WRI2_9FLAO|nr:hypothetical protein [Polaribacter porphyrae]PQJ80213.1 hypothetical protein BTO18_13970 [Polaribacter porphyrae]
MKLTKKMTTLFMVIALLLSSCGSKSERKKKVFQNNPNLFLISYDNGKEEILRKDSKGTYSFDNWNAFNVLNTELYQIEDLKFKTSKTRINNLERFVNNLRTTMPNWLSNINVIQDIEDVQEKYQKLLTEKNNSTKEVRDNWQALIAEFIQLRQSIETVVQTYTQGQ